MASSLSEVGILSDDDDDGDDSSEEGSSGSSGEDVESGDDDDDDDDDDESEEEIIEDESRGNMENRVHSSEDDPEKECCPVCLNKFIGQDLGTPESCDHTFCFDCIKEWSKNINTCPIDRTEFNSIHLRAVPGGSVLRKVKVKVQPKEAEDVMQESVTVCEICHSGDREDRLLLCDGCDLAYHCECLDPPLFYIPIEEWFCPPCSGVLQNRALAGPSSSRRRVIPRTRASETVRSRVQNLRTGGSSAPRSLSGQRKTNYTKSPRKRKRRSYRRTFKKVVQLARTKKDMNNGQKGKTGARGSTIIVTYKRRRRRRTAKRKLSTKSRASSKALPAPSTKQRIAKHLGIAKPLQGSTVPQVKPSAKSRGTSHVSKMPTHALFGNRNQLMDFDENFNEDISNMPSTSSAPIPRIRPSSDSLSSATSSLNILDSIMAGQKLLHSKSDNIVIKTDGSLILKATNSTSKKVDNVKKTESDQPIRTPMSVALVKTGVRSAVSLTDKICASAAREENASTSKTKDATASKRSKSSKEKTMPRSNSSSNHWSSKSNCSNSKSYTESVSIVKRLNAKESYKKSSVSVMKIPKKHQQIPKKPSATNEEDYTAVERLECDIPSDSEHEISNKVHTRISSKYIKKRVNSSLELECSSSNSTFSSFHQNESVQSPCSGEVSNSAIQASKPYIKKEVLSDDETDSGAISATEQVINIKKEVLSDEETNIDTWPESGEDKGQAVDVDRIIPRIKSEPIDSGSDAIKNHCSGLKRVINNKFASTTYETEGSDIEASQSIIDTVPNDIPYLPLSTDLNSKKHLQTKIKEEVSSDTEDFSQSLVSTADLDFVSQSVSSYFNQSSEKSSFHKNHSEGFSAGSKAVTSALKNSNVSAKDYPDSDGKPKKGMYRKDINTSVPLEFASKSLPPLDVLKSRQNHSAGTNSLSESENSSCIEIVHSPVVIDSSSDDDDMPYTQAVDSAAIIDSSSEDESIPCAQKAPTNAVVDRLSETDDLPCTQAVSFPFAVEDDSSDDLPCTQAVPVSVSRHDLSDVDGDDLPCTQAVSVRVSERNLCEDDDLPCTQAVSVRVAERNLCEDDDLPCTQAVSLSLARHNWIDDDLPCTQALSARIPTHDLSDDDNLPCTQAVSLSLAKHNLSEDDSLPPTQAMSFPVANSKSTSDYIHNNGAIKVLKGRCPPTQFVFKGPKIFEMGNKFPEKQSSRTKSKGSLNSSFVQCVDNDMPPTQMNFEFLKPTAISKSVLSCKKSDKSANNLLTIFTSKANATTENELLPTQCLEASLSSNNISNNVSNCRSNAEDYPTSPETVDLPDTQPVDVRSELFDLPATQISYTPSKELNVPSKCATAKGVNLSVTQVEKLNNELFDLPATQVSCVSSKERRNVSECQELDVNDESFSLPATQIFNPPLKPKNSHAQSETIPDDSLPATQVARTANVPDTQPVNKNFKVDSLPAAQLSNVNTNLRAVSSESNELKTGSHDGKSIHNKCMQPDTEPKKRECTSMNEIISNIKHLVNSLSAKDSENSNPQNIHNSKNNTENVPPSDDQNVSDKVLNCETVASDLSGESTDTEDTSFKINDNLKKKEQEALHDDLNETELSHAELKEIASKSSSVIQNKNVGIHRHLPQVIAKLPVKDHVKLKPTNRRTFSFEEVAKLEEPKTPNNLSSNSKQKGNTASDDEDELPPTQRVDFKTVKNKTLCIDSANIKSSSSHKPGQNCSNDNNEDLPLEQIHHMSEENFSGRSVNTKDYLSDTVKSNLHVNKNKSSRNESFGNIISIRSNVTPKYSKDKITEKSLNFPDLDDLPSTQVYSNISEKPSSVSKFLVDKTTNCKNHQSNSSEDASGQTIEPSFELDDLPATQACNNIPEEASVNMKKHKNSKNESSVNFISIRSHVPSYHSKANATKRSSNFVDHDDLPATQAFSKVPKNKSLNISKPSECAASKDNATKRSSNFVDHDDLPATQAFSIVPKNKSLNISKPSECAAANSKHHQSSSSEIVAVNNLSKKSSTVKTSGEHKLKNSAQGETNEFSFELESDDLPATQLCNTAPEKTSRRSLKNFSDNETGTSKSNQNIAFKLNKHVGNIASHKRKNPFSDDAHKLMKDSNLISMPNNRELHKQNGSKGCIEFETVQKGDESLSSKKLKQIYSEKQKLCQNNRNLSSAHTEIFLSEKAKHNSTEDRILGVTGKQQDLTFHDSNGGIITVKQEKIDPAFKMPLTGTHLSNLKDSSIDISRIRIKTEETSDSLPATQVADVCQINSFINDSVIVNDLLSSTSIKKEVCSDDDEISIIEPVISNKVKVKEEIIIDDEDVEVTFYHAAGKNQLDDVIKCEKEDFAETEIDISSIKKEKCSETNEKVSAKLKLQSKSSKIASKHSERNNSKISSLTEENKQKCSKDSAVRKVASKSHQTIDRGRNYKESEISKQEKQKKNKKENFKSISENSSHKHGTKNIAKFKDSRDDSRDTFEEKANAKKLDSNSLKSKSSSSNVKNSKLTNMHLSHPVQNHQEKSRVCTDKQRVKNSEKENNSSLKNNGMKSDIIITLKSTKRRSHESSESDTYQKRGKYDSLDSESCSSESSCHRLNSYKNTVSNINSKTISDLRDDRVSSSTPRSDISTGSVKILNSPGVKDSTKISLTGDVKKILNKQELKEEIANAVKLVLKPFFSTGLISKEDYKDIMRRAVPKIFMNCHSCIHQEKIRKLVHSYVALLNKPGQ